MSVPTVVLENREHTSETLPPSPPGNRHIQRSRFRQPRFLWGIGLIAVSVLLGAMVVGAADNRTTVWALSRDVAAGSQIAADDLAQVAVQLEAVDRYVAADSAVVGQRVVRTVLAGELLPAGALEANVAEGRLVTIPVEPIHAPTGLEHGQLVDVYVSPRDAISSGASRLVVASALVHDVADDVDSASGEIAVILRVDLAQTSALVSASRGGVLDLVSVPLGAPK